MSRSFVCARPAACVVWLLVLASCTPPIRQFDLKDQPLSCEQANRYAHDTLKAMGYAIRTFTPAPAGGEGVVKGTLDERGSSKSATVVITCGSAGPTLDASEDGKLLGQIEFHRAFYLTFTGVVSQQQALAKMAKEQAALPPAQRKQQGFEVLITPAPGQAARVDFAADFAAAGVLPVRVVVHNRSERGYRLDPDEIVMARADGERVHPLSVTAVLERVQQGSKEAADGSPPIADLAALPQQLETKRFSATTIPRQGSAEGYLFYPLAPYKRARVLVTEVDSDESEGVVVEF